MFKAFVQFEGEVVLRDDAYSTHTESIKFVYPDGGRLDDLTIHTETGVYKVISGDYYKYNPSRLALEQFDGEYCYITSTCWEKDPTVIKIILRQHLDNDGCWYKEKRNDY